MFTIILYFNRLTKCSFLGCVQFSRWRGGRVVASGESQRLGAWVIWNGVVDRGK